MGFSEAARTFGITNAHAVIMKSRAQHWPIPSRVQERACQLQQQLQRQSEAAQEARNGNEEVIEVVAQSWAERGEQHRLLAFQLAHNSLKTAAKQGLPIEDWRDADLADKTARRNAGLDSGEGTRISIGMALINDRLEVLAETLPKEVD